MSLKDKLKGINETLFICKPINRDYEFEAEFEDHQLGDSNLYRLHFVNYHRFGENYGMGPNNKALVDYPFKPFMLPDGMIREDAFKVLSYLTDYIEKELGLPECSQKSVAGLDELLDVASLGFTRVNPESETDDIIELFTVSGRLLLFKQSEYYSKYFEWYTEGVTLDEVKDIYERCGMNFEDINFDINKRDSNKSLKKGV